MCLVIDVVYRTRQPNPVFRLLIASASWENASEGSGPVRAGYFVAPVSRWFSSGILILLADGSITTPDAKEFRASWNIPPGRSLASKGDR